MEVIKQKSSVYISENIIKFCKKYKLNLSDWINVEFHKQFLSLETKIKQLEKLTQEIAEIKQRVEIIAKSLTSREIRYICTVTPRLREGKDLASMWRYFNAEYDREYSFDEFKILVNFYEKQAVERVKKAIELKRPNKNV